MKIQRTAGGLAEAMFDELDRLNLGESTPQQARAKSSVANSIISLCRLQVEVARFVAQQRGGADSDDATTTLPNLSLGLPNHKSKGKKQ